MTIATSFVDAYNAHDLRALAALYHPDAVVAPVGVAALVGRAAISAFWQEDFRDFPDCALELGATLEEASLSAFEWVFNGTAASGGRSLSTRGVTVSELDAGAIVRQRLYVVGGVAGARRE